MKWLKSAALAIAVIGVTIAGAAVVEKIGILATADQTVKLGDNVELWLGSGANEQDPGVGDVQARWDGTDMDVLPTADDSVFKLGNGTLSFDAWLYGNTANDYLLWDASAGSLTFTGAALLKSNNISPVGAAAITIGTASTTQVDITTDGGTVSIDGVGITPAGITSVPATGTWTFTKTSAGGATLVGADDAGAADTTLDTTGAGAITIGSADVTAITLTTDNTGDGTDVILPAGAIGTTEILDGTILAADIGTAGVDVIQICGDATTVNNNTIYYGPSQVVSATTASGMTCDTTAAGNATEATADAPAYAAQAFQVRGMTCRTVDLGATTTFTLRTAEGATVPSVVASIADNILVGVADVQTTTAVASGATLAVAVASAGDLPTSAFVCNIYVTY